MILVDPVLSLEVLIMHNDIAELQLVESPREVMATRCRMVTKSLHTKQVTFGNWVPITHAGWLQGDIDELNDKYSGHFRHHIEFS